MQTNGPVPDKPVCSFCLSKFSNKDSLTRHMKGGRCKAKNAIEELNKKIALKEQEIKYLREEEIKSLKERNFLLETELKFVKEQLLSAQTSHQHLALAAITKPTTSVRNTIKNAVIQNLLPLKEDEMKDHVPFLTIDHIKEGAEGYAKFALSRPFKNRIACTDISRKKLAWKNDDGSILYDNEGQKLSEKFFRIMKERNEILFRELIHELGAKLSDAYARDDQEEADTIVELTDKIQTWRREAYQASKGTSTDLTADFARALCNISSSSN